MKAAAYSVRTGRGLLVVFSGSSIWASCHCHPSAVWGPQRTCALPSPADFLRNVASVKHKYSLGSQYDRQYFRVTVDNDFRLATNMNVDAHCFSRSGGQSREDTKVPRLGASLFWSCWPHWKSLTLAEFCLHLKKSVQRKKKNTFFLLSFLSLPSRHLFLLTCGRQVLWLDQALEVIWRIACGCLSHPRADSWPAGLWSVPMVPEMRDVWRATQRPPVRVAHAAGVRKQGCSVWKTHCLLELDHSKPTADPNEAKDIPNGEIKRGGKRKRTGISAP